MFTIDIPHENKDFYGKGNVGLVVDNQGKTYLNAVLAGRMAMCKKVLVLTASKSQKEVFIEMVEKIYGFRPLFLTVVAVDEERK